MPNAKSWCCETDRDTKRRSTESVGYHGAASHEIEEREGQEQHLNTSQFAPGCSRRVQPITTKVTKNLIENERSPCETPERVQVWASKFSECWLLLKRFDIMYGRQTCEKPQLSSKECAQEMKGLLWKGTKSYANQTKANSAIKQQQQTVNPKKKHTHTHTHTHTFLSFLLSPFSFLSFSFLSLSPLFPWHYLASLKTTSAKAWRISLTLHW